jgi:hypothetical protein
MSRIVAVIALLMVVGTGVVGYTAAQDSQDGTPGAELCASPEASPATSPQASPEIITSGTPEVIATSVTENIPGGLDMTVCGTPEASPTA